MILVLVGREGAGPHDLRRMADQGRIYWDAAPSQWYAEPKRLAAAGLLQAEKQPGRTRERTHYTLTEAGRGALADWVRKPATLPRMQNEPVVRLLAADLVSPPDVLEGLEGMSEEIQAAREGVARSVEVFQPELPHREHLLDLNNRYAARLLDLQAEWLAEAVKLLKG